MANASNSAQLPNLAGKRAIVTGANVGLGFQTARELARAGAHVILACRSVERGDAAADKIRREIPAAKLEVQLLDLSSLASVRTFANALLSLGAPIDILVNNAGIMAIPKRETNADGHEVQMATNYLGHFALTGLLLPLLLAAPGSRVVSVASNAHKRYALDMDDFQSEKSYSPMGAYGRTKTAMLMFAQELQRRSEAAGSTLVSVAAHPGLSSTSIVRELAGPLKWITSIAFNVIGQSDADGALPQLFAATGPVRAGSYYGPDGFAEFKGKPALAKVAAHATRREVATRLWTASEQLTGVTYLWP